MDEPIWEVKCLICHRSILTVDAYVAREFAANHWVKRFGTVKRCPAAGPVDNPVDYRRFFSQRVIGWQTLADFDRASMEAED